MRNDPEAREQVERLTSMTSQLCELLERARDTFEGACECTQPPPARPFFNHSGCRRYRNLIDKSRELKVRMRTELREEEAGGFRTQNPLTEDSHDHEHDARPSETTRAELKETLSRMSAMRTLRVKRINDAKRAAFRAKAASEPKQVYRQMFKADSGATPDQPPLTMLQDEQTGVTHTDTTELIRIAEEFFGKLHAPANLMPKTGKYLPPGQPDGRPLDFQYPWNRPEAKDSFQLSSIQDRGGPDPEECDLYNLVACRCTYNRIRHRAGRNKATGPDRIPNEVLKALPEEWHNTIHALFCIAWMTGATPDDWTRSKTVLLSKKAPHTLLKNYRPVGLTNALYKLWTSHVTEAIAHHALLYGILSDTQEGGIPGRSTHRQVRNLINCIEDAHHNKRDIFVLYTDFSQAFNMTNHDHQLCMMHDMGFPQDSLEVIKGIYRNTRTAIALPGGDTADIPLLRGTVQGDPLSPLLFLLYIEPLLRWLAVGGRGYKFACLPPDAEAPPHATSLPATGFVDDTTVIANTVADLRWQAAKIDAFATWAGTPINASKCAATGALFGSMPTQPLTAPNLKPSLSGKTKAISMGGGTVPFLDPSQPYKYLGVYISLSMDWETQIQAVINEADTQGEAAGSVTGVEKAVPRSNRVPHQARDDPRHVRCSLYNCRHR